MRYLKGSTNVGLIYHSRLINNIAGYVEYDCTCDLDNNDIIVVQKMAIIENLANMLTKPLLVNKFKYCLGLIDVYRD